MGIALISNLLFNIVSLKSYRMLQTCAGDCTATSLDNLLAEGGEPMAQSEKVAREGCLDNPASVTNELKNVGDPVAPAVRMEPRCASAAVGDQKKIRPRSLKDRRSCSNIGFVSRSPSSSGVVSDDI